MADALIVGSSGAATTLPADCICAGCRHRGQWPEIWTLGPTISLTSAHTIGFVFQIIIFPGSPPWKTSPSPHHPEAGLGNPSRPPWILDVIGLGDRPSELAVERRRTAARCHAGPSSPVLIFDFDEPTVLTASLQKTSFVK
jgi:hypothetical protein